MIKVRHIRSTIVLNLAIVVVAASHGAVLPKTSSPTLASPAQSHELTAGHGKTTHGARIVLAGMRCPFRAC
jgi:hypothetical protein